MLSSTCLFSAGKPFPFQVHNIYTYPCQGLDAALDRLQLCLRRPGHHPQDDLAHHLLDLCGVGAEGLKPGFGGSQGGDAHPVPAQGLHDGHQVNPVAADPVQGGDGEGIAAEQVDVHR